MAALALTFGLGCALTLSGVLSPPTPPLLLTAALLIGLWIRPDLARDRRPTHDRPSTRARRPTQGRRSPHGRHPRSGTRLLAAALLASVLAGMLRAHVHEGGIEDDCRLRIPDGWVGPVSGTLLARATDGAVPILVEEGLGGCHGEVRAYLESPGGDGDVSVRGQGRWRRLPQRTWTTPERAGYLVLEATTPIPDSAAPTLEPADGGSPAFRRSALRVRAGVQRRLAELYGPMAPVTDALILARKEGLDPELRDAFARAGIAHLLAISGFHVGIVAGIILILARIAGLGPVRAPLVASLGAWAYVLFIGSPDAAVRAALLLSLLVAGRLRARPVSAVGALAATFVLFLLVDPGALGRAGFQLSFAGTGALILAGGRWSREASDGITAHLPERLRGGWVRGLGGGLGTGLAATLGTLPLVAWHFGQIPLFGIPMTLLLGPLVALAIPGVLATLVLDLIAPQVASFVAGGVGTILAAVVAVSKWTAAIQGDVGWVTGADVLAGVGGGMIGWLAFRGYIASFRDRSPEPWPLRGIVVIGTVAGMLLGPLFQASATRGVVEVAAVDVGQGDAIAVRSPRGRWLLVDTGPRNDRFDAGSQRVLPFLRRAGVDRIEALVLTHPDLDHIGGAAAILRGVEVGGVLDPGRIMGRGPFEETLAAARERSVGWWSAGDRKSLELDGMTLEVLHPSALEPETADANDLSVVLLLRFGRFAALLTGDAPVSVEEAVLDRIEGPVQLLKVGHHGSRTSTSAELLERLHPEVAVIPVGWQNRYGHPHPEVVARLESSGARILRTDRQGTVVVRARADGSWSVRLPDASR